MDIGYTGGYPVQRDAGYMGISDTGRYWIEGNIGYWEYWIKRDIGNSGILEKWDIGYTGGYWVQRDAGYMGISDTGRHLIQGDI